jgi:hypothetical protein
MTYFRDMVPPSTTLPKPDPYGRAQGQLNSGDMLLSATRNFQLIMQSDGNLVVYAINDSDLPVDITKGTYQAVMFATGTNGTGSTHVAMQDDGNLVVYDNANRPHWASSTNGNPGAYVRMQDDGNLVVYGSNGKALWASNTFAGAR